MLLLGMLRVGVSAIRLPLAEVVVLRGHGGQAVARAHVAGALGLLVLVIVLGVRHGVMAVQVVGLSVGVWVAVRGVRWMVGMVAACTAACGSSGVPCSRAIGTEGAVGG